MRILLFLFSITLNADQVTYIQFEDNGDRLVIIKNKWFTNGRFETRSVAGQTYYCPHDTFWFCNDMGIAFPKGEPRVMNWKFGDLSFSIMKVGHSDKIFYDRIIPSGDIDKVYYVKTVATSATESTNFRDSILEISVSRGLLSVRRINKDSPYGYSSFQQLDSAFGLGSSQFESMIKESARDSKLLGFIEFNKVR